MRNFSGFGFACLSKKKLAKSNETSQQTKYREMMEERVNEGPGFFLLYFQFDDSFFIHFFPRAKSFCQFMRHRRNFINGKLTGPPLIYTLVLPLGSVGWKKYKVKGRKIQESFLATE